MVGGRTDFSEELVSYAVEMAGRMKASILALNTGREADEASAAHFSQAADKQGVPFTHMVRPGDKDKVVAELSKAHPNLQYVMTEPSSQKSSYKAIPVYRPAPGMRRTAPRPTIQT